MRQTIVGVFDRHEAARRAASLLAESGFGPDSVQTSDEIAADADDPGRDGTLSSSASHDDGPLAKVRSFFAEIFGSAEDRDETVLDRYADTLRRGGAVVRVEAETDERLDLARMTLASAGAIEIEETAVAGEGQGGWSRSEAVAATAAGGASAASAVAAALTGAQGAMPLAQPTPWDSGHGIAGVGGGETPASLRPSAASHDAGFASREEELRSDYRNRYALLDTSYEEYEPHYRYGHMLRGDERYRGTSWDDLEPQARVDWERRYPGSSWERFKEAVRSGWHRLSE